MLTETDLNRAASATGFQADPLEKVIRLPGMLDGLRRSFASNRRGLFDSLVGEA